MSSKIFFLLILLASCGVKNEPVSPKHHPSPSLMENYPDIQLDNPLDEHKRLKR